MKALRTLIPPLAAMLMAAASGTAAQGVLVDKSDIRFFEKQMGVSVEGRFRKWKATIDFRPKDLARSKAAFEIDLGSIELASEDAESEIGRALWFDFAKFPVAKFESTRMRDLGSDRYEIAGKLTIKGVTHDVVIPVTLKKDPAGLTLAEGQFTVKRLDFRIGEGMWADTDIVANEVAVRIRMVLPPT